MKTTGVDPPHLRIIQSIKCHIGASPSVLENPIINIVIKHLCNLPWQHVGLVGCFPVLHGRGWYFHIKPSPVCSCFLCETLGSGIFRVSGVCSMIR